MENNSFLDYVGLSSFLNKLKTLFATKDEILSTQSDWNVTDESLSSYIKNKPTSLPANGGNSTTVNGHTVNTDVPSNAKFTDTKYNIATTSTNGLMSTSDKIKLDYTNVAYCTCTTDGNVADKVATIDGNINFVLNKGAIAIVKYTTTNTALSCTLNVGNTGAKKIWYNTSIHTGNSSQICGFANRTFVYTFDGVNWVWLFGGYDQNTVYTNPTLGQGYGICTTASAALAKEASLTGYSLVSGGIVAVEFTHAVPSGATLNINNRGAKTIYYKNNIIAANVIKAGDVGIFIYNGLQYILIAIDTIIDVPNEIISDTEPTNQKINDYWLSEYN